MKAGFILQRVSCTFNYAVQQIEVIKIIDLNVQFPDMFLLLEKRYISKRKISFYNCLKNSKFPMYCYHWFGFNNYLNVWKFVT